MKISKSLYGNVVMISYVFLTALSTMAIHQTTQKISPILSAFYTFLFCFIGYNLPTLPKLLKKMELIKKYFIIILVLNITTAICWIFSFISLKYLPPTLYLFIYLCAMPIASSIIYKKELPRAIILMIGIVLLATTYSISNMKLGFTLAFLGGASGTIYSIYSKQISSCFNTNEILAMRFVLTVILTLTISLVFHEFKILNYYFYLQFTIISIISIFIPLTLFQIGLNKLPLQKAMNYLPFCPMICYAITFLFSNSHINILQLAIVFTLFVSMLVKFESKRVLV